MTFQITKQGIYTDVPAEDYFNDCCPTPSLTQSIAKVLIERSPGHARIEHPRLAPPMAADDEAEPEKYIVSQAIGNAAHALLLERGKEVAVGNFENWRGKDAKEFKDKAQAAGHVAILPHHMARAYAMVEAARQQLAGTECQMFGRHGASEVVVAWQEDGLWFRTLIDWLASPKAPLIVFDYKSTALSCAPHVVADRPGELGWDIQAAMHERALDAVDPENAGRRRFYYINQENEAPYALTNVRISEHDLTMGRKKLAYAVETWRECMTTDKWPLYPSETVLSTPRGYREAKWLEREIARAERQDHQRETTATDHFMGG